MIRWSAMIIVSLCTLTCLAFYAGVDKGKADAADKFYVSLKLGAYVQLTDILVRPQDVVHVVENPEMGYICRICHIEYVDEKGNLGPSVRGSGFAIPNKKRGESPETKVAWRIEK